MVDIDNWIPKYILGYIFYISFIIVVISNASNVNLDIYDITPEQSAVLTNPSNDAVTLIGKLLILSQVNSTIATLNILSFGLTVIFVIALAKALKEIIPVFPS